MNLKRKIEILSAGCPVCEATIRQIRSLACPDCEVTVLDMHEPSVAARAKSLGIRVVPSVLIDGKLAECCQGGGPDLEVLKAAGLGQPLG